MNESTARAKGYEFQGCYSREREECVTRAKGLKEEGYNVIVATVPADRHARSPQSGYCVMIEKRYFTDRKIKEIETRMSGYEARKAAALAAYEKTLKELETEQFDLSLKLFNLKGCETK